MKKKYIFHPFSILCILLLMLGMPCMGSAREPLAGTERNEALLRVLSGYNAWTSVELNGKLNIPNLPMGIKPNVKIFMRNGEQLMVSIRAPFMGEVGRAEILGDSLLLVNKMKHTYCKDAISGILRNFPASLSDLQSLLLARVALLGRGELSVENSMNLSLIPAADGSLMLVPDDASQPAGAEYGFLAGPQGRLQALIVKIEGKESPATLIYDYLISGGHSLSLSLPDGLLADASLEFEKPKWAALPFSPFIPDKGYTRLGVNQFLKSF